MNATTTYVVCTHTNGSWHQDLMQLANTVLLVVILLWKALNRALRKKLDPPSKPTRVIQVDPVE